ncbi:MAG: hypothetical protein HY319_01880 [Armatimonadetes bacterium]|nr:hypothetical protein [Armatimonadota bacterium]
MTRYSSTIGFRWAPALLGLLLMVAPALGDVLDPRYPEDFARRLVRDQEVQKVTRCEQALEEEDSPGTSLLWAEPVPLGALDPVSNEQPYLIEAPSQWTVPPWPQLGPALPPNLPPEVRAALADPEQEAPQVFQGLEPYSSGAPSARLRPRARSTRQLAPIAADVPQPFSVGRYRTQRAGFFQICVYAGTTSFQAEDAYKRLRAAASRRESLEGIGEGAFLTAVVLPEPGGPPQQTSTPIAVPAEGGLAFSAVEIYGPARPDLLDPGLLAAQSAPAFRSIPIDVQPRTTDPPAPAPPPAQEPENEPQTTAGPRMNVLVAYFPAQAVAVELALDDRIGSPQDLIALSLLIQERLLNGW